MAQDKETGFGECHEDASPFDKPVELPITSELDLHAFRPRDVKDVVMEYIHACQERGLLKVRVIHGKGIGALRETVHALLKKHPDVLEFALAGEAFGGGGATMVTLKPRPKPAG